jgi:hypothetical protein
MPSVGAEGGRHVGKEAAAVVVCEAVTAAFTKRITIVAARGPGHGLNTEAGAIAVAGTAVVGANVRSGGAGALKGDTRVLDTDLAGVAIGVAAAPGFGNALAVGAAPLARRATAHPGVARFAGPALGAHHPVAAAEVLPLSLAAGIVVTTAVAVLGCAGAPTTAADPGVTGLAGETLGTGHPIAPTRVGAIPVAAGVAVTTAATVVRRTGFAWAVLTATFVIANADALAEPVVRATLAAALTTDVLPRTLVVCTAGILPDAATATQAFVARTVATGSQRTLIATAIGIRAAAMTALVTTSTLAKQTGPFLLSPALAPLLGVGL